MFQSCRCGSQSPSVGQHVTHVTGQIVVVGGLPQSVGPYVGRCSCGKVSPMCPTRAEARASIPCY